MDNLSLHIEFLLLHYDCVVIPDVGAFINVTRPAYYDEVSGIWHPSAREIRFNSALRHDDGLLSSSYARKYRIGFEEGRDVLRKDTARLREYLDSDGEVTLGNLGILRKENGSLIFVPFHTAEEWNSLLGYEPVKVSYLDAGQPELSEAEASSEDSSLARPMRKFDTQKNYYIAVNKIFARCAACLLVVLFIGMWFIHPDFGNNVVEQANVLPIETIFQERKSQPSPIVVEAKTEERIEAEASEAEDNMKAQDATQRFQLIVATFKTREEAEKFISSASDSGYELSIVPSSTLIRISAGGADDKETLLETMRSEKFNSIFKQSWIWEDKGKIAQ